MKVATRIFALASIVAGAADLARPASARATMAPTPIVGVVFCCDSSDGSKHCCYDTGCYVSAGLCTQLH